MSETHVISALRQKRAEISGQVHDLERKVQRLRATLASIDSTIRVFSPDLDPESIEPKRLYRRTRFLGKGELKRLCLDMLRTATEPLPANLMAQQAMATKGLQSDVSITERVLTIMRTMLKRGAVIKHGTTQNVLWELAKENTATL